MRRPLVLETTHTFFFISPLPHRASVFHPVALFLSVSSISLGSLSLPAENTHLYIFTHTGAFLYCTRLFAATWCNVAFMRYRRFYFPFFSNFFFATCCRMTDCLVERTEKPFCVPLPLPDPPFKIFIHKLPGAFYSTSNTRPTGEALSWRIQIGEKKRGVATSAGLLN